MEVYKTGAGQLMDVHDQAHCRGTHCVIHHPSHHAMEDFPTHWREDRGLMERICPHGVGHPDPDHINHLPEDIRNIESIHGCCGDCSIKGYVATLREKTPCAHCGKSPIEYHHPDHPKHGNSRVSNLVAQSNLTRNSPVKWPRIAKEIAECTPLCRSCHMKEDGRLDALRKAAPQQKGVIYVEVAPCSCCGRDYKPLRRGMCTGCYNHHTGLRLRKSASCDGCCRGSYE